MGVAKKISLVLLFFSSFTDQNTDYLVNITFIFDKCLHYLAMVTHVKYQCDKKSNKYFCKIENFLNEEINEHSSSNSNPWELPSIQWIQSDR